MTSFAPSLHFRLCPVREAHSPDVQPEAFRFRAQCFALQPDAAALRPPATPDRTGAFLACARAAASCTLSKRFFAVSSCCTFWCSFASRVICHGVARVHFLATSCSSCFQSCRMCTTDTTLALSSCCPRAKSTGRLRHIHCAVVAGVAAQPGSTHNDNACREWQPSLTFGFATCLPRAST